MGPILPLLFLKCYTWSLTHPLKWLLSLHIVIWFVPLSTSCIFCRWAPSCHQSGDCCILLFQHFRWNALEPRHLLGRSLVTPAEPALLSSPGPTTWNRHHQHYHNFAKRLHRAHLEIWGQDIDATLMDLQWQHGVGFSQSRGLGERSILYCCLLNCIKPTWKLFSGPNTEAGKVSPKEEILHSNMNAPWVPASLHRSVIHTLGL